MTLKSFYFIIFFSLIGEFDLCLLHAFQAFSDRSRDYTIPESSLLAAQQASGIPPGSTVWQNPQVFPGGERDRVTQAGQVAQWDPATQAGRQTFVSVPSTFPGQTFPEPSYLNPAYPQPPHANPAYAQSSYPNRPYASPGTLAPPTSSPLGHVSEAMPLTRVTQGVQPGAGGSPVGGKPGYYG